MFVGNPLRWIENAIGDDIRRMQPGEPRSGHVRRKYLAQLGCKFFGTIGAERKAGKSWLRREIFARQDGAEPRILRFGHQRDHDPAIARAVAPRGNVEEAWRAAFEHVLGELMAQQGGGRLLQADVDPPAFADGGASKQRRRYRLESIQAG